jgi:hypothetical protein
MTYIYFVSGERGLRRLNGGELNLQERQICPQLGEVFWREQRYAPFNVLRD